MVTRDTTSATEALQLMVERRFRHLVCPIVPFISRFHSSFFLFQPVCNEDGNVVGLLDITKVFREAVDKVERSSTASEKLQSLSLVSNPNSVESHQTLRPLPCSHTLKHCAKRLHCPI
jgi:hypothetical protein